MCWCSICDQLSGFANLEPTHIANDSNTNNNGTKSIKTACRVNSLWWRVKTLPSASTNQNILYYSSKATCQFYLYSDINIIDQLYYKISHVSFKSYFNNVDQ